MNGQPTTELDGRCTARTTSGKPCRKYPIAGGAVCRVHGGSAPQVKAAAERRIAEAKALKALGTYGRQIDINPVEALLEEIRWTAGHVAWLRERVQEVEQQALVWGRTTEVDKGSGEHPGTDVTTAAVPNVWLDLYQRERKHLVDVCKAAIGAGIEERRVRLAEQQGDLIVAVLQNILAELMLTAEQQALVPAVASRHLRAIAAVPAAA